MFYDELNKILEEFVGDCYNEEDYVLIRNFTDIILNSKSPWCNAIYHSKMGLDKCTDYSIDFLKTISPKYSDRLCKLLEHGRIEFLDDKEEEHLSYIDVFEGSKFIKIYQRGTIEDSYNITHEVMHEINMDVDKSAMNWQLMTEAFSICAERLQMDYFARQSDIPRNYRHKEHDTLYALYCKAIVMDFELKLISAYHKYGAVNKYVIDEILGENHFSAYINSAHLKEIVKDGELSFDMLQRDIIGGIMSTHMYERISNKRKLVKEFVELNDWCNEMDFVDTLKYLDLDVVDPDSIIVSRKSIRELTREYRKRCKNLTK